MTCPVVMRSANCVSIKVWKVAGALQSPKVITNDSYSPSGVLKAVFHSSPSRIHILLYPQRTSSLVKNRAPNNLSISSGISGMGAAFFLVISLAGR